MWRAEDTRSMSFISTPRSSSLTARVKERDGGLYILTKDDYIETYHVFPYYLGKNMSQSYNRYWKGSRVRKKRKIVGKSSSDPRGSLTPKSDQYQPFGESDYFEQDSSYILE